MSITKIAKAIFNPRLKEIDLYVNYAGDIQQDVLTKLLTAAKDTDWGRKYDFRSIQSYEDFQRRVPIQTYDDVKLYVQEMIYGEQNILWPSDIHYFAKSSGTTSDKSKFLPLSKESLKNIHYRGAQDVVTLYLQMNPQSKLFSGKALILGGSHAPSQPSANNLIGDLSAILIENINFLANLVRVPSKKIALMDEWDSKIEAIVNSTMNKNVTNLSGVPSWMLVVLKKILEKKGKTTIEEVWPNLEVFFHGGVAFTPYREQYAQIIKSPKMHYVETYNASEGFFGIQNDLLDPSMLLMIDYDIFYEFIPLEELDNESPKIVPLEEVELNKNYALVISTSSGLWRYMIGDTVKFTNSRPYKFIISGRTKHFINAFGEELIIDNAEKGLANACKETGAQVLEYSAAPVYMDENAKCCHQWLIEFEKMPDSLDRFAEILDQSLKELNSDYEAKRSKDIALQPLQIIVARKGLFYNWLAKKGKLGGQHKVPRLSNSRVYIEEMIELNK